MGAHRLGLLSGGGRHAIRLDGLLYRLLLRLHHLLLLRLVLLWLRLRLLPLLPGLQAGVYWRHQGPCRLLLRLHGLLLQPRVCWRHLRNRLLQQPLQRRGQRCALGPGQLRQQPLR